jgi:hypothetical protein
MSLNDLPLNPAAEPSLLWQVAQSAWLVAAPSARD